MFTLSRKPFWTFRRLKRADKWVSRVFHSVFIGLGVWVVTRDALTRTPMVLPLLGVFAPYVAFRLWLWLATQRIAEASTHSFLRRFASETEQRAKRSLLVAGAVVTILLFLTHDRMFLP